MKVIDLLNKMANGEELQKSIKYNDKIYNLCIDDKGNFINTESPFVNEVIPETLCQCTGLQDIDGNYIFENDIVDLNNIEFRVDYSYGSFEFSHDANIDKNCDDADYINPIDYKVDECKIIRNKFDKEVE